MNVLYLLPVWLLFFAVALPLSFIAWSSRQAAHALSVESIRESKTISKGPIAYDDDGTRTQTITVQIPKGRSITITQTFGPIAITVHGRAWAAYAVLLGLVLVFIGLLGLFHFPSALQPSLGSSGTPAYEAEEP